MNGLLRAPESKKSSWTVCIKGILLSQEVLNKGLHSLPYDNQYSTEDIGKPGRAPASSASLATACKTKRSYISKQHTPGLRHLKEASPRPQTSQSSISQASAIPKKHLPGPHSPRRRWVFCAKHSIPRDLWVLLSLFRGKRFPGCRPCQLLSHTDITFYALGRRRGGFSKFI